jgi:hypothetical protein
LALAVSHKLHSENSLPSVMSSVISTCGKHSGPFRSPFRSHDQTDRNHPGSSDRFDHPGMLTVFIPER